MKAKIQSFKNKVFIQLLLLVLICFVPILHALLPGLPVTHDTMAHFNRALVFDEQFKNGTIPVRFAHTGFYLAGSPLFNYYPPFFYYTLSGLNLLTNNMHQSFLLVPSISLLTIALTVFTFCKEHGTTLALLAALLFISSPYIHVLVFVRGAHPELIGLLLSLIVLLSIKKLSFNKHYFIPLTICSAALLTTHPPTALIYTPIFVAYALYKHLKSKKNLLQKYILASLIALGLASFYILPNTFEINHIHRSEITKVNNGYVNNFVKPSQLLSNHWGYNLSNVGKENQEMSFQLGYITIGILLITLVITLRNRTRKRNVTLLPYLLALLYSFLFSNSISLPLWNNIEPLSFILYPFRFLSIVTLVTCLLLVHLLKQISSTKQQLVSLFIAITILIIYFPHAKAREIIPADTITTHQITQKGRYYLYLEEIFLPKNVNKIPGYQERIIKLINTDQQVQLTEKTLTSVSFVTNSTNTERFIAHKLYYPGWTVTIDNKIQPIQIIKSSGLITGLIPPGKHQITLRYTNTHIKTFGNIITFGSLITLLFLIYKDLQGSAILKPHVQKKKSPASKTKSSSLHR